MDANNMPMQPLDDASLKQSKMRDIWLELACLLLVIAAGLHSADKSIGGGDTWVAMACGRYTLGSWAKDQPNRTWQMKLLDLFGIHCTQQDPFGAETRAYKPESRKLGALIERVTASVTGKELDTTLEDVGWINQNWLTHVLFYKMKTGFGENSIVIYKFIQAILTALFAYWAARALGVHPSLAAATAVFGILLSRSFVDLRPNVSTILFAAIMIMILARWRNGHVKSLLWFMPVMIIWSNIHGGFIYAILIFTIAIVGYAIQCFLPRMTIFFLMAGFFGGAMLILNGLRHAGEAITDLWKTWAIVTSLLSLIILVMLIVRLNAVRDESYYHIPRLNIIWLAGGLVGVALIPAIFSPFGMENLIHPMVIAVGEEGRIWRNVIEWKPMWDKAGFGNITPYICFLIVLEIVFAAWWILWCLKPVPKFNTNRKKGQEQPDDMVSWPRADITIIVIMILTVIMSLKSRRFVFLAGVVLCPYLARMIQDVLIMLQSRISFMKNCPITGCVTDRKCNILTGSTALAAFMVLIVFGLSMKNIYFSPPIDGIERTVFRRMVGINDQPVRAMQFVDANRLQGVMFNEWTNGGYVAFGQEPLEETGEPRCKVYMDGRAQAAYRVSHFARWQALNPALSYDKAKEHYKNYETYVRQKGFSPDDPAIFDALLKLQNSQSEQARQAQQMLWIGLTRPELYNNIFKREGITVALLTLKRASSVYIMENLLRSRNWTIVFMDDKELVLLRNDAPENEPLLKNGLEKMNYPDEFTRKYSQGYHFCNNPDPSKWQQGLDLLMSVDENDYVPLMADTIYKTALRLRKTDQAWEWFQSRYQSYKAYIESGERFGRFDRLRQMTNCCENLGRLAEAKGDKQAAADYNKQSSQYETMTRELMDDVAGGLFW